MPRPLQRTPAPLRHRPVISRRELPLIERNPRERRPLLLVLALLAFLAWGRLSHVMPDPGIFSFTSSSALTSSDFRVEGVTMDVTASKNGSRWQVRGTLFNSSRQAQPAPDLVVQLIRDDRSVAAETVVAMGQQIVPQNSAAPFTTRLLTGPGETVRAVVTLSEATAP